MIDSLFSAALAFTLLIGGTVAIGSAMFEHAPARDAAQVARQEIVVTPTKPATLVAATKSREAAQTTLR